MNTSYNSEVATPWSIRTQAGPGDWSMQVHRRSNVEVKVIPDSSGYTSDRSSHKISLPVLCPSLFQILATPLHDTLVGLALV